MIILYLIIIVTDVLLGDPFGEHHSTHDERRLRSLVVVDYHCSS